jgi:cytochrome c peroxidase
LFSAGLLTLAGLASLPAMAATAAQQAACRAQLAAPAPASADAADRAARQACINQLYRGPRAAWPDPTVDAGVRWQELGPRPALPDQPPALVALGEQLFFDNRLSRARDMSCASCHAPHLGFSDGRRLALGHEAQSGPRNTPHLLGVAFVPQLMWDGRAPDLETQALMPIANPVEMAMDLGELQQRLSRETDYPQRFAKVFGDEAVTLQRLGQALAAFERRIEAPRSRFDDFIEGKNPQALNERELHGLHLFRTKARCMNCHSGPQFTQHEFHQIGMSALGRRLQDLGRQVVTGKAEDVGAMRTPSLRAVGRTAPYFHHGITPTLRGVLESYNAGMPQPPKNAQGLMAVPPSALIQPLRLNARELQDLEAFLRTL